MIEFKLFFNDVLNKDEHSRSSTILRKPDDVVCVYIQCPVISNDSDSFLFTIKLVYGFIIHI